MRCPLFLGTRQWSKQILYRTTQRRWSSSWTDRVSSRPIQAYISTTDDPYLNLSIEHYLLQKSPEDSTILFLYVNRPCIVIGRNQNPWSEVNLARVAAGYAKEQTLDGEALTKVDLVRRRSGGGTVFHDSGNVNWSVICPPGSFTRDKHCEMVVRALRSRGIERARVNERHDIVLDQGTERLQVNDDDMHRTPFTVEGANAQRALKVSGSAYKLTKGRALHHATALLESPHLREISMYLHSPARPYIQARGVESVSSPVANLGLLQATFIQAVREQFGGMYSTSGSEIVPENIGIELLEDDEIRNGWEEMHTPQWTFDKTPQFTLSAYAAGGFQIHRDVLPKGLALTPGSLIRFRDGRVKEAEVAISKDESIAKRETTAFAEVLNGQVIREVKDWTAILRNSSYDGDMTVVEAVGTWLNIMLPDVSALSSNET